MSIPFCDLAAQYIELKKEIDQAIKRVIVRGDFILGEEVGFFEKEFARFCGTKYALGVSSGTAALFLSLVGLDIGKGDEVIVPDFTFIATSLAVSYTGATPVFVDIENDTYTIDPDRIESAITKKTKAIIPVHLFGHPADMRRILSVARRHNLKIIEDAAQAHGARIRMPAGTWSLTGALGDVGCFSFYPSKNLGGFGDGGMIVTNDQKLYQRLLVLRDCGRVSKYEHAVVGYNSRLDTLQAAVLRVKLKKLKSWNQMRQQAAKLYDRFLKGVEGVITPFTSPDAEHIYHVYALRLKDRDRIMTIFKKNQISALVHYPIPLHLQKAYRGLGYKKGDFPVSEKIARQTVSLPMYPYIKEAQVRLVTDIIAKYIKEREIER